MVNGGANDGLHLNDFHPVVESETVDLFIVQHVTYPHLADAATECAPDVPVNFRVNFAGV